jgi:hypothetical protein
MSDDNVITLSMPTTLDIPPERVIKAALEADLDMVLIIGWTEDGKMYASCSTGNMPETLFLIEKFKQEILRDE